MTKSRTSAKLKMLKHTHTTRKRKYKCTHTLTEKEAFTKQNCRLTKTTKTINKTKRTIMK